LEPLVVQYADYAVWQREWLQGEVLEEQLRYWREQLSGMQELELVTDRPRPQTSSRRGGRVEVRLRRELSEQIRQVSRQEGVTVFMTLLAGFQLLLSRYSGQREVVVGTDVANREQAEVEGLIGFFVNQLVLRTRVAGEMKVRELLREVRQVALGAYEHQEVPFEKLVEELSPERDLSRSPLFQVMIILQNTPSHELQLSHLQITRMPTEHRTSKCDLTLILNEADNRLQGAMEYAVDLFAPQTIRRLLS